VFEMADRNGDAVDRTGDTCDRNFDMVRNRTGETDDRDVAIVRTGATGDSASITGATGDSAGITSGTLSGAAFFGVELLGLTRQDQNANALRGVNVPAIAERKGSRQTLEPSKHA